MRIEKYELTKKNIYNVYLSNGEVLELNGKEIILYVCLWILHLNILIED